MKMKEKLICAIKMRLADRYDAEVVNDIINLLSLELTEYRVEKESYDLVIPINAMNHRTLQMFLVAKRIEGLSDSTLELYSNHIGRALVWIGKLFSEVGTNDIRGYIAYMSIERGISEKSQNSVIACLRSFFGWLLEEEMIEKNPMGRIKKVKEPKRERSAFSDVEVEIMRNAIKDKRDRAIFEFLLSTGCRVSEVVNCNIADISGDEVKVIGKGDKQRTVYLNAKARVAITDYLNSRDDDSTALFVGAREPHKRLGKRAIELMLTNLGSASGVENVFPHRFRHTVATNCVGKGMELELVQRMLGHTSANTTLKYAHIKQDAVKSAHQRYVG